MGKRIWNHERKLDWGRRAAALVLCLVMSFSLIPTMALASNMQEELARILRENVVSFYKQSESRRMTMVSDMVDFGFVSSDGGFAQVYPDVLSYVKSHPELFAEENSDFPVSDIQALTGNEVVFVEANGRVDMTYPLEGKYREHYLQLLGARWWEKLTDSQRKEFMQLAAVERNTYVYSNYKSSSGNQVILKVPYQYYSWAAGWYDRPGSELGYVLVELDPNDRTYFSESLNLLENGDAVRKDVVEKAHMGLDSNTYLLRVGTGVAPGDNVMYLGVRYRDTADIERTEFLFPHEGSLSDGYRLAEQYGSPAVRLNAVKAATGYSPDNSFEATDGLTAYSDDTYLFQPDYEMAECLGVDVMLRYPMDGKGSTTWTCTGMYLYHVEELYGVDMVGYYSDAYYISFRGKLLTKLASDKSIDLTLNRSDRLFRLGREIDADLRMVAINENSFPELMNYDSQSSEYLFKMDIADVYEGGIEALAAFYNDHGIKQPVEALTLNMTYTDIYGKQRTVNMPMITSMIGWLVENGIVDASLPVAGIAQQGESILFPASLPDFRSFDKITLTFGSGAAKVAGITASGASSIRTQREKMLANETLSITGIQIYPANVKVSASIEPHTVQEPATAGAALKLAVDQDRYQPLLYFVWSDADGYRLKSGLTDLTGRFSNYTAGASLVPSEAMTDNSYIVEIDTDSIERAGTKAALNLRLGYISATTGTEVQTPSIDLKESTRNYYGYWPGEDGDSAYIAGAGAGGTLVCKLNLDGVGKFTSATLSMDSHSTDDWQMKAIRIYKGGAVGNRVIVWEDTGFSDRRITRTIDETDRTLIAVYPNALDGTIVEQPAEEETEEETQEDEGVIQKGADMLYLGGTVFTKTILFGENSKSAIEERKAVDWIGLRYSMTYKDALQDLGFDIMESTYRVDVKVASNDQATGDSGDCGSKNLFYFKLIFEGGSSGYVLANQQLSSDGFRADRTETFYVSTNRDYGALESISIIPEDNSGSDNQDPFDKLNISYIDVTKETADGLALSWRIENVGWIDVNYRDKAAESGIGGRIGRTESEMASVVYKTSEGYSLNLLVGMTTGSYKRSENDVNKWASDTNPQFRGSMIATVEYYDHDDMIRRKSFDVVRAMYDYANLKPEFYSDKDAFRDEDGVLETRAKSDPNLMFRGGHTDWFFMNLPDVKQILRIRFGASSEVSTVWNLNSLSIYTIEEKGTLQITAWDEYQYNGTYKRLCSSTDAVGYPLQVFAPENGMETLGEEQEMPVLMEEHKLTIDESGSSWTTTITETPVSQNDSVNIYVYMKPDEDMTPLSQYNLKVNLCWNNIAGQTRMDLVDMMDKNEDAYVFSYTGMHTSGIVNINQLMIETQGPQVNFAHVNYAVVQHVRSGVTIDTWYLNGEGRSAENGGFTINYGGGNWRPETLVTNRQVVKLFISQESFSSVKLVPDSRDIAVAIRYRTTNDQTLLESVPEARNAITYNSPYVFLSKYYDEIRSGMIVEIPFAEESLASIEGITLVGIGDTNVIVDCGYAATYDKDDQCTGWFNFAEETRIVRTPYTMIPTKDKTVIPVRMTFQNGSSAVVSSTTDNDGMAAPINMTITYINEQTRGKEVMYIHDLSRYLTKGSFQIQEDGSNTAEVQFFMKNARLLRFVTLEPYSDNTGERAIWSLNQIYVEQTIDKQTKFVSKVFTDDGGQSQPAIITEGSPLLVNLSTVGVKLNVQSYNEETGVTTNIDTDVGNLANLGIMIPSGNSVTITPTIIGTMEGFGFKTTAVRSAVTTATGATGRPETTIATETVKCYEEHKDKVIFTPPDNTGTETVTYIVTICSEEIPEVMASVPIVVQPAPPLPEVLEEDYFEDFGDDSGRGNSGSTGESSGSDTGGSASSDSGGSSGASSSSSSGDGGSSGGGDEA